MYGTMYGMVKTTLYLPDDLKSAVALKARREGKSEAEVIRQALVQAAGDYMAPMPRVPDWPGDGTVSLRVKDLLAAGFGKQ